MTRALIVHSGNMYGGVERVLETIAQAPRLGVSIDPSFALCFEGQLAETLRRMAHMPDMLGEVRLTRLHQVWRVRSRFAAVLRQRRVDVVMTHSPWAHAIFAPVARRAGVPLLMWVHDELSGRSWLEKLARRHQPDLLVCNSFFSQRAARSLFPSTPSRMIRCPLILNAIGDVRETVRERLGTPDGAIVIVNVARMEQSKGQHMLIDALSRLRTRESWICWIVGGAQRPVEARYERSLKVAAHARGLEDRVVFLGQRHDVEVLLSAADVFCYPTQGSETFGLAIIEALHARLPVIASGRGGPQEILTESCGILVPTDNRSALVTGLELLIDDARKRRTLAEGARARAVELCEPIARLAELTETLASLALKPAA